MNYSDKNSSRLTGQLFEDLIRRILESQNFEISQPSRGNRSYDLIGEHDNKRWAIEVKYYRTTRAQPSLIETAATRLVNAGLDNKTEWAMLIVSCIIPSELRTALETKFNISFVDQKDLRHWAFSEPQLAEELDALLETDTTEAQAIPSPRRELRTTPLSVGAVLRPTLQGSELCRDLENTARGKSAWKAYEKLCEKILKYLFPNDLHGWHSQKRTDDGLNRYDFICRMRPTTEFWKFAIEHLDSRYVLFEFKNHSSKIKQGEILTTEKYLLERALRRMAIVFTRTGADSHAVMMSQGAMREHGKLILVINDEDVCNMLHMKEQGNDPTDYLFELADNFLLTLPR